MSAPASPSSVGGAAAAPRKGGLLIHQLSPGSKASPALYAAESDGWSNEGLEAVALELFRYQVEKEWHDAAAPATVYSFVKHDVKSTKNIVVSENAECLERLQDQVAVNKIIFESLGGRAKATFIIDAAGKFNGMILLNSADLSGLRAFYGAAPKAPS